MRKKFKKIMAVVGSTFMIGSTIGLAFAAGGGAFPVPFVKDNSADYAIVYGANAAASDLAGANSINTYLNTFYSTSNGTTSNTTESTTTTSNVTVTETAYTDDFSNSVKVTDDEIGLGSASILSYKLKDMLDDNKISTLLDTQINWDNGLGTDSYNIHEEILLTDDSGNSNLKIMTNLNHPNGDDLNSLVVLQNDESLRYRLVFDDTLIPKSNAKELIVDILGKEYIINKFNVNEDIGQITISLSEEKVVKKGLILNVEGISLTIGEIFTDMVEINGILVKENIMKNINGLEIEVTNIATHSSDASLNKAVIRVGKKIEKVINSGDEYIEGNETWEWDIGIREDGNQYIGVRYDLSNMDYDVDEPQENPIIAGGKYIFPENYAALSFDRLTNVVYNEFKVEFDDVYLYNGMQGDDNDKYYIDKKDVVVISGEKDNSFTLISNVDNVGEVKTNTIYLYLNGATIEVFFKDIDYSVDDIVKAQYAGNLTEVDEDSIRLVVKNNELDITISGLGNEGYYLKIDDVQMDLTNSLTSLGIAEQADATDIIVNGIINIGTRDKDVMNHYGIIIKSPESNADSDRVVLSIPSEQVYAEISVYGKGSKVTETVTIQNNVTNTVQANETNTEQNQETVQLGGIIVKDTEINSVMNKNLIIVGGSCINAEAARLLGGKACGSDFTLKTGITAGKALVQTFASPHDVSKVAVVVAGYHAEDTTRAVNQVINDGTLNIEVGQKHIV